MTTESLGASWTRVGVDIERESFPRDSRGTRGAAAW
jgi:hypothetical protein